MKTDNKEAVGDFYRHVGGSKKPMNVAKSIRQQTLEEERKCKTAIQLLLTELVRQQMAAMEISL